MQQFLMADQIATVVAQKCIVLLKFCGTSVFKLKQIHAFSIKQGVPISNPEMGKHLLYAHVSLSSHSLAYARNLFDQISNPNVFSWNTMIRAYAEGENCSNALALYRQMHVKSIKADTHTYPFVLKAVAKMGSVEVGEMIHSVVVRNGFETLLFVQNGLVHMYGCFGHCESACKVFDLMPVRDVVAWNSLINCFAVNHRVDHVFIFFRQMFTLVIKPDGFTLVSLLSACTELGDNGGLAMAKSIHGYVVKVGLELNSHASNALLNLYAKCGCILETKNVFAEIKEKGVVSWTSLIVGLATNGFGKEALEKFEEMEREGHVPSEVTFIGVLCACSHCGMVKEGLNYFERMKHEYGIVPRIEHHGCIVDLLGRVGLVRQAYEYIQNMALEPNAVVWRTLLGACVLHGDLSLGKVAREKLLELEPNYAGDYVSMSNLYATEQQWLDVHKIRGTMLVEGLRKTPGQTL